MWKKHMDVEYDSMTETCNDTMMNVLYISTERKLADDITKLL